MSLNEVQYKIQCVRLKNAALMCLIYLGHPVQYENNLEI